MNGYEQAWVVFIITLAGIISVVWWVNWKIKKENKK